MQQKIICGFFLLFLVVTGAFAAPVMTDSITGPTPLLRQMTWLPDPVGRFDIAAVRAEGMQASFVPLERGFPLNAAGAGWLRLDLAKQQPGKDGSMPVNPEHPLILNMGGLPSGLSTLYTTGRNGLPTAQDTWYAERLRPYALITLPDPGLAGSTVFIHMQETPGLWFTPMLSRGAGDALLVPPDLLLPGLILACMVACLLRAVGEKRLWRLWAALMLGCVLVQELLPLPVSGVLPTYGDLPAILAPGLCLIIFPHLGRLMLRTHARSPVGDTLLKLLSLVGVCVCLAPLLPGYGWLKRLFPLWGLLLVPLLPFAVGALASRQTGALAFLGAIFMPAVGAALSLYFMGQPAMHPVAQSGALWGAAIGGIALALARIPRDLPQEEEAGEEDMVDFPPGSPFALEPDGKALILNSPVAFPEVSPVPLNFGHDPVTDAAALAGMRPGPTLSSSDGASVDKPLSAHDFPAPAESFESFLQGSGLGKHTDVKATPDPEASAATRPFSTNASLAPFTDFGSEAIFGFAGVSAMPAETAKADETAQATPPSAQAERTSPALFAEDVPESLPPLAGATSLPAVTLEETVEPAPVGSTGDGITVDTRAADDLFAALPLETHSEAELAASGNELAEAPEKGCAETIGTETDTTEAGGGWPVDNTGQEGDLPLHPFAELVRESIAARGENASNLIDFDPLDEMEIAGFQRSSQSTGETYIFNLLSVIREIHSAVAPLAEKKGILLSWHSAPSLPPLLLGDVARLRQTLTLLLQNALLATSSGAVQLFVREDPEAGQHKAGRIQFTVRDTGAAKRSNSGFFHAWELADTTGGSFSIEYAPGGGTLVNFTTQFKVPSRSTATAYKPDPGLTPAGEANVPLETPFGHEPFPLSKKLLADMPLSPDTDASPLLPLFNDEKPPLVHSEAVTMATVDNAISVMLNQETETSDADTVSPNVIISDMTTSNRRLLAHYLNDCHACCVNAHSLAETSVLYAKSGANLIIYDADSPEREIVACMERVRECGGNVAQLVLTSHAGQVEKMRGAGATCTIEKPFAKEAFLELVRENAPAVFLAPPRVPTETGADSTVQPAPEPGKPRVRVTPASRTALFPAPAVPDRQTTPEIQGTQEIRDAQDDTENDIFAALGQEPVDKPVARAGVPPVLPDWADKASPMVTTPEPPTVQDEPLSLSLDEGGVVHEAAPFEDVNDTLQGEGGPDTLSLAEEGDARKAVPSEEVKQGPQEAQVSAAPLLHSLSLEDVLGESRTPAPHKAPTPLIDLFITDEGPEADATVQRAVSAVDATPEEKVDPLADFVQFPGGSGHVDAGSPDEITAPPTDTFAETATEPTLVEDAEPVEIKAEAGVEPTLAEEAESDVSPETLPDNEPEVPAPVEQRAKPLAAKIAVLTSRPAAQKEPQAAPRPTVTAQVTASRPVVSQPVVRATVSASAVVPKVAPVQAHEQPVPPQTADRATPASQSPMRNEVTRKKVQPAYPSSAQEFSSALFQTGELPEPKKPLLKKYQTEAMLLLPGIEEEYLETLMLPLVPGLLHTLKDTLKDAIRGKNEHQSLFVQEAVNRLSGKAEVFGLERLAKIANCVERAAEADDFEAVDTLLEDLIIVTQRYIESLQECYDQFKNKI